MVVAKTLEGVVENDELEGVVENDDDDNGSEGYLLHYEWRLH